MPALATPAGAAASGCANVRVPGAAEQQLSCLDDLTTTGTLATGHTVQTDWAGLTSAGFPVPHGVPGIQIVPRRPGRWNGGLVVSGSPGVRRQYANDRVNGDLATTCALN